jgi:hypothetical protein
MRRTPLWVARRELANGGMGERWRNASVSCWTHAVDSEQAPDKSGTPEFATCRGSATCRSTGQVRYSGVRDLSRLRSPRPVEALSSRQARPRQAAVAASIHLAQVLI